MAIYYFLGANSADGFASHYGALRPKRLRILKGGPGCGKSTLMKKVAAKAEALGYSAERIPCSSDPASLDGVLIPALGYGVVDGTAPHIVEPPLCGCGAVYVDLGIAYAERDLLLREKTLREIQAAGSACYPPATACLRAAAALGPVIAAQQSCGLSPSLARSIGDRELEDRRGAPGSVRTVFLSGHTPDGRLTFWETVETLCPRVYALSGSDAQISAFLEGIQRIAVSRGWDVWRCESPLVPFRQLDHLLCPALGLAFVASRGGDPYPGEPAAVLGTAAGAENFRAMQDRLIREAVRHLHRAKEYHDLLESAVAPYVDFSVPDQAAETCCGELETLSAQQA